MLWGTRVPDLAVAAILGGTSVTLEYVPVILEYVPVTVGYIPVVLGYVPVIIGYKPGYGQGMYPTKHTLGYSSQAFFTLGYVPVVLGYVPILLGYVPVVLGYVPVIVGYVPVILGYMPGYAQILHPTKHTLGYTSRAFFVGPLRLETPSPVFVHFCV